MARLRAGLRLVAPALVLIAAGAAAALPRTDTSPAASGDRATLVDDDGGRPMFTVPAVAPGRTFTRCIRLTYRGGGARLRLSGTTGGSGLADRLQLTIERGSGGAYDSCAGFRGALVYSGTVSGVERAAISADDAAPGAQPTYRFTVSSPADLSGERLTATAAFSWVATENPADEPAPTDTRPPGAEPGGTPSSTAPPATTTPATAPPAAPDASDGAPAESSPDPGSGMRGDRGGDADPSPRAEPRPGAGPSGSAPRGTDDDSGGGLREGLRNALRKAAQVATEGARRGAFPVTLLLFMLAFVVAQSRIDSRDPKLALAPVHAEPDLLFAKYEDTPIPHSYVHAPIPGAYEPSR